MSARVSMLITVMGMLLLPCAHAQQLNGKLFTSPEQRAYLDALRQRFLVESRVAGFDIEESEIPPLPTETRDDTTQRVEYTLGGILTQRDGSHVIWLNNRALSDAELPDGVTIVREAGKLALRFRTAAGNRLLLPGQTIEINSATVRERYQRTDPPPAANANESDQP